MTKYIELRQKYDDYLLSLENDSLKAEGRLNLTSNSKQVALSSNTELHFQRDEKGWIALNFIGHNGESVSIRKSILLQQSTFHGGSAGAHGNHTTHIYGNTVLLNSNCIGHGDCVSEINFSMQHFVDFFYYWPIESFHTFGKSDFGELLKLAREHRGTEYDQYADYNSPTGVVFISETPKPIDFEIDDCNYSVWIGRTESMASPNGFNVTIKPMFSIKFNSTVSVEAALNKMWDIHSFFSQLAGEQMLIDEIVAFGEDQEQRDCAQIYLPSLAKLPPIDKPKFSPYNIPYCSWEERAKLSSLLQKWLADSAQKKTFRNFLQSALPKPKSGYALSTIVELCSAVDSLQSIPKSSRVSKPQLAKIVAAAEATANVDGIDLEKGQIQRVLSNLRSQPFRDKITFVVQNSGLNLSQDQLSVFIKRVGEFRTFAAHGAQQKGLQLPMLSPTIDLFRLICISYDLTTSGLCSAGLKRFLGERDFSYLVSQLDSKAE